MELLPKNLAQEKMNKLGSSNEPFLFIISFDMEKNFVEKLDDVNSRYIKYNFNGKSNYKNTFEKIIPIEISDINPISIEEYKKAFTTVQRQLHYGNTYLLNLTSQSEIKLNESLDNVFYASSAKYKIYVKDKFVCFSPEIFVKIKDGVIRTFPMKGTIDASVENALDCLMEDKKEIAEHNTIVDLLRNDLSMFAKDVHVARYRYFDYIKSRGKSLIQLSSEIVGNLDENFNETLGDIIFGLLPAGSISGAPKAKTVEIINEVEKYDRGFYTGICGIFDGKNLDSAVMIRFIEKDQDKYYYKSGGGITIFSDIFKEYQELKDKIYVPIS